MPRNIRDLMQLTGRSHAVCVRAIESGHAPGYRMATSRYTIPDEAFELFAKGYWEPVAARVEPITPQHPVVRSRNLPVDP